MVSFHLASLLSFFELKERNVVPAVNGSALLINRKIIPLSLGNYYSAYYIIIEVDTIIALKFGNKVITFK